MNPELALAMLRAHGPEALTVTMLADCLQTSARNIDYWIERFDLPKPFFRPADPQRYWRPDEIIAWVEARQQLAFTSLNVEQIAQLTGLSIPRWRKAVREGGAPRPIGRELGTGRLLWSREEVTAWLEQVSGGYRFPRRRVAGPRS